MWPKPAIEYKNHLSLTYALLLRSHFSFLGKLFGAEVIDVPRKANFEVDVDGIREAVRSQEVRRKNKREREK